MLSPGEILEKYEIISPIAGGGMGVVYKAKHQMLQKEVAIKLLLPNLALSENVRTRFQQEAYVQAQLQHQNIVQVTDYIQTDKHLGFVMDIVQGVSLEEIINNEKTGQWNLEEVVSVMGPVLEAMAYAHKREVVHRDLKPANILLERSTDASWPGFPKVTDFGLAKILSSEVGMTKTGAKMGTLPYMSPEQFEGKKDINARADVFALGMIMLRLFAGRLPVDPEDMKSVMGLYFGQYEIKPLHKLVDIPLTLSEIVMTALSFDIEKRQKNALELKEQVQSVCGSNCEGSQPFIIINDEASTSQKNTNSNKTNDKSTSKESVKLSLDDLNYLLGLAEKDKTEQLKPEQPKPKQPLPDPPGRKVTHDEWYDEYKDYEEHDQYDEYEKELKKVHINKQIIFTFFILFIFVFIFLLALIESCGYKL